MSKSKQHIPGLVDELQGYAEDRMLDFHQYSPYHLRIMDGGFVILDAWTTGRYYVVMTDYKSLLNYTVAERQGEKGQLPSDKLWIFLDGLFYGQDVISQYEVSIKQRIGYE